MENKMRSFGIRKKILIFTAAVAVYSALSCPTAGASQSDAYYHYILGNIAEITGDVKKAISEYEMSASFDSDSLYLKRRLAGLYMMTGNTDSASKEIQFLLGKQPNDKQAEELLAETYIYQKKNEEAIAVYESILSTEPANKKALFNLGVLYSQAGKYEEAASCLKKYTDIEPSSPEAYIYLGIIYNKINKPAEAEIYFKKAQETASNSALPLFALADFYEEQKDYAKALEIYDRIIKDIPGAAPDVLLKAAGLHLAQNNIEKAKEYLLTAEVSSKTNPLIPYYLGLIYSEQKDYTEALNYFDETIKRDKKMPEPYSQKGYILTAMGENKKAVKSLLKAEELGAVSPLTYFLLALNYEYMSKTGKAEFYLKKAAELDPKNERVLFELGALLDKQKKYQEAEKIFLEIIQIDTAAAQAYNYLGYTYADRNIKLDEAEKLINTALGFDPENGAYIDSIGWLNYRKKNYPEALRKLLKSASKMEDPTIYDHLGDCYQALGNTQMAVDSWESSYNIDKNSKVKSKIKKYGKNLAWDLETIKMRALRNFTAVSGLSGFVNSQTSYQNKEYEAEGALFFKTPDNVRFEMLMPFAARQDIIIIKGTTAYYTSPGGKDTSGELSENMLWINNIFGIFGEGYFDGFTLTERKKGELIFIKGGTTLIIDGKTHFIKEIDAGNGAVLKFYDYKPFGKIKFPKIISIDEKGKGVRATVTFKNLNINTNLKSDIFNIPERGNKQ